MKIDDIKDYLKNYDGPELKLMEVCGSHTAAISKFGIKSLLSSKIQLVSGPGCPVCVTPSAYIDRLIELAIEPGTTVVTFGDMIRVPGSDDSLQSAKSRGAKVKMVYSPMDIIDLAQKAPEETFVFAAVGFETTTPVYTLLLDLIIKNNLENVKLLTALKTMPEVISLLLDQGANVDGFLAPGHVCAVTGYELFEPIAAKYNVPFAVGGFEGEELLVAIYSLVKMCTEGKAQVVNCYTSVVEKEPNKVAAANVDKYFEKADAVWRGVGLVPLSGMVLRPEYDEYDAGSRPLVEEKKKNNACRCGEILRGAAVPTDCPLFGKVCTPQTPQGACMVSYEGCCYHAYGERH